MYGKRRRRRRRVMQAYIYKARDLKTGRQVGGEIDAENEPVAAKLLNERGLSPLEIKLKTGGGWQTWRNRIPGKQKVIFSRQLATLVGAGLPLVQSLTSVRDQSTSKPLKEVIDDVINDVEAGSALSAALAKHPKVFNNIYISLVAAGETSGTLDESLERLASQQEKDAQILSKVRGALIYPSIVLMVLVGVVIFMLTTVLPSVQGLYADLPGAQLPLITRLLLSISNALTNYWWLFILLLGGGIWFSIRYLRTLPGRQMMDHLKLRIPGIKQLYKKLYMARFARIAATLVSAGVPILKMLSTTAESVGNIHVKVSIDRAAEQVKGGNALSESLVNDPNFTPLVPSMIRIGEQSGSLDTMLSRLADYYESEVDTQIKSISTVVEPVLMVAVGVIAMIVVAAVLLPIYNLAGRLSGL
ncbi:type II secretion system F family protein [Candidatus Saccharibacteria bacterium]|nr:type II secretion system F family protein [Candidatus Saccharibacteria bacterium]